jgi:quinol monooxygenase YgiN
MVYVSITGLKLHAWYLWPAFAWHAVRSMRQARAASGNRLAQARTINGIHHTLSVWDDEAAMHAYRVSGAHRAAMRAFPHLATGTTVGFRTDATPAWSEVHEIWRTHAENGLGR